MLFTKILHPFAVDVPCTKPLIDPKQILDCLVDWK
jgi:hypothetical protein